MMMITMFLTVINKVFELKSDKKGKIRKENQAPEHYKQKRSSWALIYIRYYFLILFIKYYLLIK